MRECTGSENGSVSRREMDRGLGKSTHHRANG
jgi:hypothetical protein